VAAEANFDNPTVVNGSFETGYGGHELCDRHAGLVFWRWSISSPWRTEKGTVGFINPGALTTRHQLELLGRIPRHHQWQQPAHGG